MTADPKRPGPPSRQRWLERANELPEKTGVYFMRDRKGAVVYVGKAKSLRTRVRSYFQEGTSDNRAFIAILTHVLHDIETIVTSTEKEALLLERELIRRHEPRFNVIWRDDKQFLCLRIDTTHEYPRVDVVRQLGKDGARYFGPFHSATAARQTLRVLNRHFQLRTCPDSVLYHRSRPCLEYQIGRCPAPCVFEIDRSRYKENVEDVIMFLEGSAEALRRRLEARMWAASEASEFEVAAHYRDQIAAVEKTLEKQRIALPSLLDQDVFGLHREGAELAVAALEIRSGRIQNVVSHFFEEQAFEDAEVLESFLLQRYLLGGASEGAGSPDADRPGQALPPAEILVPASIETADALADLLGERRGSRVSIKVPQRGDRARLLEMARQNAEHAFHENRRKSGALEETLGSLQEKLRLAHFPMRIECYDISNLGGTLIVGSRVVFHRALPYKNGYRRYRVKASRGQDDFSAMYEVLMRRFHRGKTEGDLPDLVVVDGGKGQLNVARAVMKDLEIEDVDVISLAKSRVLDHGTVEMRSDTGDRATDPSSESRSSQGARAPEAARASGAEAPEGARRTPERVFVPGAKEPIVLRQDSPELLLLARLRDEAHRFAITYHRALRSQSRLRSTLDDIPGIGAVRKRALLRHFGSLRRVRTATVEELSRATGVGRAAAERIFAFFHSDGGPSSSGSPAPARRPPGGPPDGSPKEGADVPAFPREHGHASDAADGPGEGPFRK